MNELNFNKLQGLIPAVIQDADNGEILMVGFMNPQAFERTQQLQRVTFFSRTRQTLWTKGETSGNQLEVVSMATDCDRDSLLIKARVLGAGVVCHEGTRSCFNKPITAAAMKEEQNP